MIVRNRIDGGSGIWTMIPAIAGSAFRRRDRLGDALFRGVIADLDEPAIDAGLLAAPQDLLEVDHRRGIAPDDHHGQPGRPPDAFAVGRDVLRDGLPDLRRDRPAEEQPGAPSGHDQALIPTRARAATRS